MVLRWSIVCHSITVNRTFFITPSFLNLHWLRYIQSIINFKLKIRSIKYFRINPKLEKIQSLKQSNRLWSNVDWSMDVVPFGCMYWLCLVYFFLLSFSLVIFSLFSYLSFLTPSHPPHSFYWYFVVFSLYLSPFLCNLFCFSFLTLEGFFVPKAFECRVEHKD